MVPLDEAEVLHLAESAHDIEGTLLHLERLGDAEVFQGQGLRVGLLYDIDAHLQRLLREMDVGKERKRGNGSRGVIGRQQSRDG